METLCYVFIDSTEEIGIVKWGEGGYYKTDLGRGHSKEEVDCLNEKLGIDKANANAM